MEMIRAEDTRSLLAMAHREDLHVIDPDNFAGVGSLFLVSSFKRCFESNKAIAQEYPSEEQLNESESKLGSFEIEDAAIAGIVFSVLMIWGLLLIRLSVRASPLEEGTWLRTSSGAAAHSLYLVPFAGIASYGSSASYAIAWESLKIASLALSFSAADFCSSR
jgi:hypothetical protein